MDEYNRIDFGDAKDVLEKYKSLGLRVQMCITSPPYFGLRDYGVDGQIGLEDTPDEYIGKLVDVFRSVRDILAKDGTLWLNIGDSYMPENRGENAKPRSAAKRWGETIQSSQPGADLPVKRDALRAMKNSGIKRKDLIGIPWMLAFALRADGWYLRQDIIWHKSNPVPEGVTDRCIKSHEYIFLLSKSERYFFDNDAIKEPSICDVKTEIRFGGSKYGDSDDPKHATKSGNIYKQSGYRNRRSVWTVPTKPYKGAHSATFPPDLISPCILAGSRLGDVVLDPFMGSGTTAMVARSLGRKYLGAELNLEYEELQRNRINSVDMALPL